MRTLPSGNLKNFCADAYPHLSARALKTKRYINNRKLFHAKQVFSRNMFNSTLRSQLAFKSFCLRDRGRLGNEGQPILLKIGTQSRYVDLCDMPEF